MLVQTYVRVVGVAFVATVLVGYVTSGVKAGTWWPIPTISTTWVLEPANFVSREVIGGFGALSLAVVHVAIYFATRDAFPRAFWMLALALAASFCLSMLAVICNSDNNPECLGSGSIHNNFAKTYFVLTDAYMIIMSLQERRQGGLSWTKYARLLALVGSLACKFRFFFVSPSHLLLHDIVSLGKKNKVFSIGFVEWVNTSCVLLFLCSFASEYLPRMKFGIVAVEEDDDSSGLVTSLLLVPRKGTEHARNKPREIVWSVSSAVVSGIAISTAVVTLAMCYAVNFRLNAVALNTVPELSDLFVLHPANQIARFGGVIGTSFLAVALGQFYYVYEGGARAIQQPPPPPHILCLVASQVMALTLSLCMCVSKIEDSRLHTFFVACFFTSAQSVMLWISAYGTGGGAETLAPTLVSLMCKIRFAVHGYATFAWFELLDATVILVFFVVFARVHRKQLAGYPLALYYDPEEDASYVGGTLQV